MDSLHPAAREAARLEQKGPYTDETGLERATQALISGSNDYLFLGRVKKAIRLLESGTSLESHLASISDSENHEDFSHFTQDFEGWDLEQFKTLLAKHETHRNNERKKNLPRELDPLKDFLGLHSEATVQDVIDKLKALEALDS